MQELQAVNDSTAEIFDIFSGLPVPGGLSERLWHDSHAEVHHSLHHPFVTALAAGTLPKPAFQHYILQDAFFLSHFAKAYAAALDKLNSSTASSRDEAQQSAEARDVLSQLLLGVHQELQLHGSYAAKWGVDVTGAVQPSPATAAYCSFLMEVAEDSQASVAEVLAAMIPCARLYGYLGCQLAAATAHLGRHAYSDWLDTYSGAEYLECPRIKEELFDKLIHSVPYDRLKNLYKRAMELEVNFFSAQPETPSPRNIALLVVDFDDTCTSKDTVSVLLNAAVEANVRAAGTAAAAAGAAGMNTAAAAAADADSLRQQLSAQMKQLADNYVAKQRQLLQTILPQAADAATAITAAGGQGGTDSAAAYNAKGLRDFCESLSSFDVDMNQVVIDAGALKGLSAEDVRAAAAAVELRPGCAKTLSAAAAAGIPVALLSVNWSTTLINAALGLQQQQGQQQQQQGQQQLEVHANELVWGPDGCSTGQLWREIECGRDKDRMMQQLLQRHRSSSGSNGGNSGSGAVVYVGDSASDILPLLRADYGLVIGHNKLLRQALSAFGVILRPLCSAPLQHSSTTQHPEAQTAANTAAANATNALAAAAAPVLYEASSWHEIAAFLFGPPDHTASGSSSNGSSSSSSSASSGFSRLVHVTTDRAAAAMLPADGSAVALAAAAVAAGGAEAGCTPPAVLTIAGSDCGGGAGIQADLKTIMANGGFGMSVITALTAQNSRGVHAVHVTPADFLSTQLDSIYSDLPPAAIKTGMLPNAEAVEAVAAKLKQYYGNSSGSSGSSSRQPPLVVDPVLISTSGHALAAGGVGAAIKAHLAPLATMITPNLTEAEALCGLDHPITCLEDMVAAAKHLHSWGCKTVLIKGGHLVEKQYQQQQLQQQQPAAAGAGAAQSTAQQQQQQLQVVDVLYDGQRFYYYAAPFIATDNMHGTGCTLAAAIATALAAGQTPVEAVATAKGYLTAVLAASRQLNFGQGPQHPFHHGAGFRSSTDSMLTPAAAATTAAAAAAKSSEQGLGWHQLNPVDLRVYVVTDPGCNAKTGRSLMQAVVGAVEGGATIVQLREKEIDGGDFLREARAIVQYCRPKGIPVIINDRVDVALAADADGVHVGQSDLPARIVRQMLGPDKILGVSVKTAAEAAKAQADGADYIGVGAVFPTGTKVSSVIGLEGLKAVCEVSGLPAVAIGGVGANNAHDVIQTGVAGLAVVSAVFAAPDVAVATRQLREAVDQAIEQQQQQERADVEVEAFVGEQQLVRPNGRS